MGKKKCLNYTTKVFVFAENVLGRKALGIRKARSVAVGNEAIAEPVVARPTKWGTPKVLSFPLSLPTYDMAFAEPVVIVCEDCGGHRYSRQALSYTYKGKNIDEVMSLTVDEALEFFDTPKIRKPIKALPNFSDKAFCLRYKILKHPSVASVQSERSGRRPFLHQNKKFDKIAGQQSRFDSSHKRAAMSVSPVFGNAIAAFCFN